MKRRLEFSDQWKIQKSRRFDFYDVEGYFEHVGYLYWDSETPREIIIPCIWRKEDKNQSVVDVYIFLKEEPTEPIKYAEDVFDLPWESWQIEEG